MAEHRPMGRQACGSVRRRAGRGRGERGRMGKKRLGRRCAATQNRRTPRPCRPPMKQAAHRDPEPRDRARNCDWPADRPRRADARPHASAPRSAQAAGRRTAGAATASRRHSLRGRCRCHCAQPAEDETAHRYLTKITSATPCNLRNAHANRPPCATVKSLPAKRAAAAAAHRDRRYAHNPRS